MTDGMTLADRTGKFALITVTIYTGVCLGPVGIGALITGGVVSVKCVRPLLVPLGTSVHIARTYCSPAPY